MIYVSTNGKERGSFATTIQIISPESSTAPGMDEVFSNDFLWTNNGGGRYTGSIGTESMTFSLADDTLTMTINPKKLGLNPVLNMDILVEMHRV